MAGKITAKIFDFAHGLRQYEDVRLIRLKSKDYRLAIMEDHLPLLGTIEQGSLEIVTDTDRTMLEHIDGYYMHKKNVFELIVKE